MKKFMYLLLCLIPALGFTSCSDDDKNLPDVKFEVTFGENNIVSDDVVYVVAGEQLVVEGINVVNMDENKRVLVPYVNYFWDYDFIGRSIESPFGYTLDIPSDYEPGNYILEMSAPVYALDKSPAYGITQYRVTVVADRADLPDQDSNTISAAAAIRDTEPTGK